MITFQLDECINNPGLAQDCNDLGLCHCERFPGECRSLVDSEMLAALLPSGNPIVTTDYCLLEQHCHWIPDIHPGIIVLSVSPLPLTMARIRQLLYDFKREYPKWNSAPWQNSVVELHRERVSVARVLGGAIKENIELSRTQRKWTVTLGRHLLTNSTGNPF